MLVSRWTSRCRAKAVCLRASRLAPRQQSLLTLAIESSCDDTSVAILETNAHSLRKENAASLPCAAVLHFHQKVTADNRRWRGVHPIVALVSHQDNLAKLITTALDALPEASTVSRGSTGTITICSKGKSVLKKKPDFVSVTRGPGMRSNLSTGLDTAKGLAVAWQVPLVGVNHMQAHALTPRLVSALELSRPQSIEPSFPFLSLLVSGGHTLLVHSKDLADHAILATTSDIAIGNAIDRIAKFVLPEETIQDSDEIMYGRALEQFAFPNSNLDHNYTAPAKRGEELKRKQSRWGWSLGVPLAETRSGLKSKSMEYSFSGLESSVKRICQSRGAELSVHERRDLAREAMMVAFEHLASRAVMALKQVEDQQSSSLQALNTIVVSGGVASNSYLRTILRSFLDIRGYSHVKLSFPPPSLCTDNAAMIAWTGIEMYENGWTSDLSCKALQTWSIDPQAKDGGILGVENWTRRVLVQAT